MSSATTKPKLKFVEYTLPAYWACALINGDESGMDDDEVKEMDAWLKHEKPGHCVNCSEESFFAWDNDATDLGGDCLVYTFQVLP